MASSSRKNASVSASDHAASLCALLSLWNRQVDMDSESVAVDVASLRQVEAVYAHLDQVQATGTAQVPTVVYSPAPTPTVPPHTPKRSASPCETLYYTVWTVVGVVVLVAVITALSVFRNSRDVTSDLADTTSGLPDMIHQLSNQTTASSRTLANLLARLDLVGLQATINLRVPQLAEFVGKLNKDQADELEYLLKNPPQPTCGLNHTH